MKTIINIEKNQNFITRYFFPQTIPFQTEDGSFDVCRVGFGDKVVASVKKGASAPHPLIIYRRYDDFVKVWCETALTLITSYMGLDQKDAEQHLNSLVKKYLTKLNTQLLAPEDALKDHFGEAFTGKIEEQEE